MFESRPTSLSSPTTASTAALLRILHLEDDPGDAELVRFTLEQHNVKCQIVLADGKESFERLFTQEAFDLVLADYILPNYDGLTALQWVRVQHPNIPFILVSGALGEEQAVDILKSGATDYVLKTRLARLPTAVRRALSEAEFHRQYQRAEECLQQNRDLFRQITDNVEDLVTVLDLEGRRVFASPSYRRLFGEQACVMGTDSFQEVHPDDAARIRKLFADTAASGAGQRAEYRFVLPSGTVRHIESQGNVIRNLEGQIRHVVVVSRDVTERKETEARLAQAQKELVEMSRLAGMAEATSSVLHNVGNVLNSVNVAASCVAESLKKSRVSNLTKIVNLLHEHETDLGSFLTTDPKGKMLPNYLAQLTDHLVANQAGVLQELAHLQKNIEHIKDIVNMQQSFAKASSQIEALTPAELVEDALRMNQASFEMHDIKVLRDFTATPPLRAHKHYALQILVNLLRNAKHACEATQRDNKEMSLRILSAGDRIQISVSDNGVGIPPENLAHIFTHGFTTKKNGHGFGLHSGALAAKEMGGALHVHSAGAGQGATFTLELPIAKQDLPV